MIAQCIVRSIPNICQHALAVAEDMKLLSKYLQWVQHTKKSPNLSLLISDSIPKTGGKKSAKRRKGPPKSKQTNSVDQPTNGTTSCTPTCTPTIPPVTTPPPTSTPNFQSFPPNPMIQSVHNWTNSTPYNSNYLTPPGWIHGGNFPFYQTYSPSPSVAQFQSSSLYPNSYVTPVSDPIECFRFQFLEGTRIRMCYGCSNPIHKDTSTVPPSPHDVVIAYKERRWYRDPHTQYTQSLKLTTTAENTYYHFARKCIEMKHPSFTSSMLHIPPNIVAQFTMRHKMQLRDEFSLNA